MAWSSGLGAVVFGICGLTVDTSNSQNPKMGVRGPALGSNVLAVDRGL